VDAPDESDESLMHQVALGNREHLATLVRRNAGPLLTFIQRMTGDRHLGEELFKVVFLAVWTHSHLYSFPRPFKAWLFGIAANKCRADARHRRIVPPALDVLAAVPSSCEQSPVEAAIASETAALVEQAVARLPDNQRAVLVMRVWNEMSYLEIAEVMGRTEGTIRSHMFHALAAMRRWLEPRLRS
jgi:RNA polymerase sigma-70 factor, ECF subfamily